AKADLTSHQQAESVRVDRDVTAVRLPEVAEAQHIIDIEQRWLGFRDSSFPAGAPHDRLAHGCLGAIPLEDAAAPLVQLVREFKPHVMVTYDEKIGRASCRERV